MRASNRRAASRNSTAASTYWPRSQRRPARFQENAGSVGSRNAIVWNTSSTSMTRRSLAASGAADQPWPPKISAERLALMASRRCQVTFWPASNLFTTAGRPSRPKSESSLLWRSSVIRTRTQHKQGKLDGHYRLNSSAYWRACPRSRCRPRRGGVAGHIGHIRPRTPDHRHRVSDCHDETPPKPPAALAVHRGWQRLLAGRVSGQRLARGALPTGRGDHAMAVVNRGRAPRG